jgi:hypothetical protein
MKTLINRSLVVLSLLFSVELSAQMSPIDPIDIEPFTPIGDPSAVLGDLNLWFCGNFYHETPVLVRSNLPIKDLNLRIIGGTMLDFGRPNEFLIRADTTGGEYEVLLRYGEKTFKQGTKLIPDPIIRAKLGGQLAEAGMASISAAKTTNLIEFVGEYTFIDDISCYPLVAELMVEGQVELKERGATKMRIDFGPAKSVDIKQMLDVATPGSQLIITQFNCMVDGEMVTYRSSPTYAMVVLIN